MRPSKYVELLTKWQELNLSHFLERQESHFSKKKSQGVGNCRRLWWYKSEREKGVQRGYMSVFQQVEVEGSGDQGQPGLHAPGTVD